MGGKTVRSFICKIDNRDVVLDAESGNIRVETASLVFCDSPRCASRHDGKTTTVSWVEEKAISDPFSLPESFSGLITIKPNPWNMEESIVVCSAQCARDYFMYLYAPAKSPRQLKQENDERLKVNPAAQEAIDEALAEGYKANAEFDRNNQMVLPFGEPTEFAAQTVEAVEDSTGYPN
jgi:hypothetical protein